MTSKFILLVSLGCASGTALAQDLPFSSTATEDCLEGVPGNDLAAKVSCIGKGAEVCIDTPDGYTTVGMGSCYRSEASFWDARLNTAFAALMAFEQGLVEEIREIGGTIPDAPGALRDMQRSWMAFRDASCAYEYTTWGGGTGGGPATAACLMTETGRQALVLEQRLADRSQ